MNRGFEYQGKRYIINENELFRMSFERNLRFYGVKKCAKWMVNDVHVGYILGSSRKSHNQIFAMLEDVDYSLPIEVVDSTPC